MTTRDSFRHAHNADYKSGYYGAPPTHTHTQKCTQHQATVWTWQFYLNRPVAERVTVTHMQHKQTQHERERDNSTSQASIVLLWHCRSHDRQLSYKRIKNLFIEFSYSTHNATRGLGCVTLAAASVKRRWGTGYRGLAGSLFLFIII